MTTTWTRGRRARPLSTIALIGCVAAVALGGLSGCGASKAKTKTKTHGATPTATTKTVKLGWNVVASPAVGAEGNLEAVAALSATSAWAVGQYEGTDGIQHTLIERWDGSQWSVVASPSPGLDSNLLSAVSADSASDAWAVGTQMDASNTQQPLIEHWNGSQWSVATGNVMGHQVSWLSGVSAISPNDVWAVGTLQRSVSSGQPPTSVPLVEHWQGSSWTIVPQPAFSPPGSASPVEASLSAVAAVSASDVWAVGVYGPKPLIERWDGVRWNGVANSTLPPSANGQELVAISADAANDIWAVGSGAVSVAGGCGVGNSVVIEHWDGSQWTGVTPAIPPNQQGQFSLAGVAAVSPSNVWAVGGEVTYDAQNGPQVAQVIEHWDGARWSLASIAPVNSVYGLLGVAASEGTAFTVGQHHDANGAGPTLVEQLSGGATWSPVASPSPGTVDNRLLAVAGVSSSNAWAVGESGDGTLAEHWNGSVWSVAPTQNGSPYDDTLNAVTTISAGDAWAVGTAPNTDGIIEHWNGAQWSLSPGVSDGASNTLLYGVAAVSSMSVYATGWRASGPLVERWNGSAWSALPALAPVADNALQYESALGVAALADNNVWVVGGNVPHSCGGLLPAMIEHWDGAHWTSVSNLPQGALTAISASGPNDIWAVGSLGNNQSIMRYDGKTWAPVSLPGSSNRGQEIKSVSARASNDVWVVGVSYSSQGEAPVAFHWDGKAWTQTTVAPPRNGGSALYGVAAVGATDVWAVGYFNGYSFGGDQQALIERNG